jgi:hypothetical protein
VEFRSVKVNCGAPAPQLLLLCYGDEESTRFAKARVACEMNLCCWGVNVLGQRDYWAALYGRLVRRRRFGKRAKFLSSDHRPRVPMSNNPAGLNIRAPITSVAPTARWSFGNARALIESCGRRAHKIRAVGHRPICQSQKFAFPAGVAEFASTSRRTLLVRAIRVHGISGLVKPFGSLSSGTYPVAFPES